MVSLSLKLQPTTFAGQQSLMIWAREPADGMGDLDFDLQFVQGADQEDAGVAASHVHASSSQQSGTVQVVFPHEGYVAHGIYLPETLLIWSIQVLCGHRCRCVSCFIIEFICSLWLNNRAVQATLSVLVTMFLQLPVLLLLQPLLLLLQRFPLLLQPLRRRYCKLFLFS